MILNLDHIAVLVTDVKAAAATLPDWLTRHELEEQPAEGTLEQYACPPADSDPCLLLMEAVKSGPYETAMTKRGPGLHHLAYNTDSITDAALQLGKHGLLLHPMSLKSQSMGVVWMCRPGIPFLLELTESADIAAANQNPTVIELPVDRFGEMAPIDFLPNVSMTRGSKNALVIRLADAECVLDLTATST